MVKLENDEYAPYYQSYIEVLLNNEKDIITNLEDSLLEFEQLLNNLEPPKQLFQYAEGKWTIKEIIQHIIDTERVFNYRALRFARKDTTELPGFDENLYVANCHANQRDYKKLLEEFISLRKSTIALYQSFDDKVLLFKGKASGNFMSVRALGFISSGHLLHHLQVIKSRYL
ncbi:MAG: DinB family protein [Flavobacteriaceae bacterium]|nr:DinB family protein [Flavobacteriaceae bacterium]